MSRFTSRSPLIKKTLYIYHLFSLLYALISSSLSPTLRFTPFSLPCCHLWSLIPSDSSLSLIFPSHPLSPNSPTSLYFYHSIAVISPRHRFNTPPPFLTKPFLHPSSLSLSLPFHLDLYVSVGLSILWRPGSKLKWFWGLHWSLIEFKKRKCHKEN